MDESTLLAQRFEEHRPHLRSVAYRMLGSLSEADDAVQETWLRLSRADADGVENLEAWLTTVVSRMSLNMLRTRAARREQPLGPPMADPARDDRAGEHQSGEPEQEAVLADSVGLALLVVLDRLTPHERLAFVLHDMFAMPFDEVGPMVERSPAAARQLASRARRKVKGAPVPDADLARQRGVVDAYLTAVRSGDLAALVELLDADVVLRADAQAVPSGKAVTIRGSHRVANGALASAGRARSAEPALVDGTVGLVMAPHGQLGVVLRFVLADDRITEIDVIADPDRLRRAELAVLD